LAAAILLGALAIIFPGLLAFAELAARELRYLWWMVLCIALGLWLALGGYTRKP
jgi:threonine/homoserine efflux transporter RhtA